MIILILSEARSGSVNLMEWLKKSNPDYIVLTEPYNKKSIDFITEDKYDTSWIDFSKDYVINEKFYPNCGDLTELINISDLTLALYRENSIEQIESFIIADVTDSWRNEYNGNDTILKYCDTLYLDRKLYFEKLKIDFQEFIKKHQIKSFTYEGLYYRNEIDDFKKFFEIKINIPFPYGKKYRIDTKPNKLL